MAKMRRQKAFRALLLRAREVGARNLPSEMEGMRRRYGLGPAVLLRLLRECESPTPRVEKAARFFLRSGAPAAAPSVAQGLATSPWLNGAPSRRLADRPKDPLFVFSAASPYGPGKRALWDRLRELGADPLALNETGRGFEHAACRMANSIEGLAWWRDQGYALDRRDGARRTIWSYALERGPLALELTRKAWPDGFSWELVMGELYDLKEALARWSLYLNESAREYYLNPRIVVSGVGMEVANSVRAILKDPQAWEWVRPGEELSSYLKELRADEALVSQIRQAERLAGARAESRAIDPGALLGGSPELRKSQAL